MAEIYGTKKVLGYRFVDTAADLVKSQLPISMLLTSLLGILTPLAAYTNIWAIFALRVAQVFIVIVVFMVIRALCHTCKKRVIPVIYHRNFFGFSAKF